LDPVWGPAIVEWNSFGMRGEIEVRAQDDDSKEDVTRPQSKVQRPWALEPNASGRLVAHLTVL